ncbi:hypothetical protein ACTZWT_03915 [Rhodopseudomonas sp. NSM]|uniref:hypothetical protein n=1 Tax=Rhodopseudomonas sp. NSM TaxID=3457630 RepID=UPI0040375007
MRQIATTFWMLQKSPAAMLRVTRLTAVALGIGLVMAGGVARAEDGDNDDLTFEEKIIKGLMGGIGATNMENSGINYRERSPLVVPRQLELPPPEVVAKDVNAPPNWPKDPDVQARKEARSAARQSKPTPIESARQLTPSELNSVRADASKGTNSDPVQPGTQQNNPILSPSQLGFTGSFSSLFGGNKTETAPFTGEPTRETLTQPPVGYQTPSPNFAYGTGPKEALGNKRIDVMSGKEVTY